MKPIIGWREAAIAAVAVSSSKLSSTTMEVVIDEDSGELLYPDGIGGARTVLPMAVGSNADDVWFALIFILLGDDRASVPASVTQAPLMGVRFLRFGGSFISAYVESCNSKALPLWHAAAVLQTVKRTNKKKGAVYFNPRLAAHPWGSFTEDSELMSSIAARVDKAEKEASAMAAGTVFSPPRTPIRRRRF